MPDTKRDSIVEIWKTIVDVQQHFNDISMRIRGMFVTILVGLFAAIGFLLDKPLNLTLENVSIKFSTLMPLVGILGTALFYFMDRFWYHRLLVGSVKHAIEIEKKYRKELPELSLSDAIGAESPFKPKGCVRLLSNILVRHDKYWKTGELHSDGKIELFYKSVMLVLALATVLLALFGGVSVTHPPNVKPPAQCAPTPNARSGSPATPSSPAVAPPQSAPR